jgi:LacI family transcriptional regulator, galactose operon repressor
MATIVEVARLAGVSEAFHQHRVNGVILAPSAVPEPALAYLANSRLPCVPIDRLPDPRFDAVGVDDREAMRSRIDHAVSCGHRRIGLVAGQPGLASRGRPA